MITKLTVEGDTPLVGTVQASGSKNSALPIMAGAILLDGHTELKNVPYLKDTKTMIRMLNALNIRAEYHNPNTVKLCNSKCVRPIAPYDLITSMRASFFVTGPILAKAGYAKIPHPGGCSIGARPIDLHLKGFKALGATVNIEHGFVEVKAKSLKGTRIYLDFPSVGATENVMMAATLAEGQTIIENSAREPEICDLADFLITAGAKISGAGTPTITIDGVRSLTGITHSIIPDRVEAGTLLIAGAITKGDVTVENVIPDHIEPLIRKLKETGLAVKVGDKSVQVAQNGHMNGIFLETLPFPGFPTDMQAQMMALLCLANGPSHIKESIFENRFMHAQELMRMGAAINLDGASAHISGVDRLTGAELQMTDLRAGAALVLAALAAQGTSTIYGLHHLKRGYENLPQKIRSLGGKVFE